jgi:hypothetical protein
MDLEEEKGMRLDLERQLKDLISEHSRATEKMGRLDLIGMRLV